MSDMRTQLFRKYHEWGKHLTLLKVPERTHTSCLTMMLMSPLHSETLNLVRRRTNILRYEWHEYYAFQKIPEPTHSSCFTMTFISFVHSASFSSQLCRKWWAQLIPPHFTIILLSLIHCASFSVVRQRPNFLHYGSLDNSIFQRYSWNRPLYEDFDIGTTFCTFTPCKTQDKFSPSWVTWELKSSKITRGKSYLPFCDDCYVFCTLCKFESSITPNQNSTLSVTWELNSSFDIGSTLWKFTRCTTQASFLCHEWGEHLSLNKEPERTHTSCFTMIFLCPLRSATLSRTTHSQYSLIWVTGGLSFLENTRDNSILLFYDDIYIFCTFCVFQPCTAQNKFSPSWATYLLIYDNFWCP